LDARLGQLPAHEHGHGAADDARHDGEDQVEGADVLVVGRVDPANPAARLVIVMGVVSCSACHFPAPYPVPSRRLQLPASATFISWPRIEAISDLLASSRLACAWARHVSYCSWLTT